mgnify:FL=1|jgi:hypothetical protein
MNEIETEFKRLGFTDEELAKGDLHQQFNYSYDFDFSSKTIVVSKYSNNTKTEELCPTGTKLCKN